MQSKYQDRVNKFCFSKKTVIITGVVIIITSIVFLSLLSLSQKKHLTSKASVVFPVIGGRPVLKSEVEYSSVAKVESDPFLCSGTAINPRWVVTAAHCLKDAKNVSVAVGITNNQEYCRKKIRAAKTIIHPEFEQMHLYNDIGLILLERPISDKIIYPKIPQPNIDEELYAKGNVAQMVGWGCVDIKKMSLEDLWRLCPRYKTLEDCNQYGKPQGCGYHMGCELCMPWGRSEIDEIDYTTPTGCSKLRKIAEEYMKTTSSNMMPTPYRRLVYSDNLQKIDLLIEKSEYEDWPNQFQVERSDDKGGCAGDSGGPTFFKRNGELYLLGVVASAATQTKVIRYKKWIDEIIRTTTLPPTPMSTPVPKKFDAEHLKTCLQYTRCNPYGLPLGCIFHGGLQLCLPWGDPTIDYSYSCENLLFIEQQIKDLTPTPSPTPRYD